MKLAHFVIDDYAQSSLSRMLGMEAMVFKNIFIMEYFKYNMINPYVFITQIQQWST